MIIVIATIEVVAGGRDAFLEQFYAVTPAVRAEDGCLEYGPTLDVETSIPAQGDVRPNTVTIVEKWESLEALEAHLVAAHMVEYRGKVKELVQNVSLQVLQPCDGK